MWGKHCSNPQYFFLNYKAKFSTNSIFKKIDKDNFEKKIKKKLKKTKTKEEVNFGEKKKEKKCKKKKKEGKIRKKTNTWGKLTFMKHITMTVYRTNLHFSTSII